MACWWRRLAAISAASILALGPTSGRAATEADTTAETFVWSTLHSLETQALRKYEFHVVVDGVRELGEALQSVARSSEFERRRDSCGSAAQTLGFMVTIYYESSLRREIASGWHQFAKSYAASRTACLAALKIDQSAYPLPYWFGR